MVFDPYLFCRALLQTNKENLCRCKFRQFRIGSLVLKISRGRESQLVGRKSQLVVPYQVVTNSCCSLAFIFCGFISLLIGRETVNKHSSDFLTVLRERM